MDKVYNHTEVEEKLYKNWEENGYFQPEINPQGKPYCIILPPPNASGKMHTGNVLMIAIEDLLIRWHRMKGYAALWLPGTDHAGFETQITFEKELKKEGKSRFDFSREDFYKAIDQFVKENKHAIEEQIRRMGASVDWGRYMYTLDKRSIETVYKTFEKMYGDGLIYRKDYLVNYCPKCGTTFADLEINYVERKDPLYYIKYGPFTLVTVRPETKFGDTAVAVNPKDKRYKKYVGKEIEAEDLLGSIKLKVIADSFVDPKFGTGVVKVTPAHDKNDFEAGLRHNLEIRSVINLEGKLNEKTGKYKGLPVKKAREVVVCDLQEKGLIEKIDEDYIHTVAVCYKGGHDIEPMVFPNWFVKVESLKKPALQVVLDGKVRIYPKWREITYTQWMEQMRDWPISRQTVWGIQFPVWYNAQTQAQKLLITFLNRNNEVITNSLDNLLKEYSFEEVEQGLQKLIALESAEPTISREKPQGQYLRETDTFDTWFSSGQWPLITLGYPDSLDFKKFYPTDVLETGWEIIRLWVSRMIMFGLYLTGRPPFKDVYLHGIVRAIDGRKMSKSLGNIINPEEYIDQYGVDALRMGLISGTANGKDFVFPKDKVIAYKHFANKIWNMGRFLLLMEEQYGKEIPSFQNLEKKKLTTEDKEIIKQLTTLINIVEKELERFRFADAGEAIYHFMWHTLADKYIEQVKTREDKDIALSVLLHVYTTCIKLLHPFMPFVTEEIYQHMPRHGKSLMIEKWPE